MESKRAALTGAIWAQLSDADLDDPEHLRWHPTISIAKSVADNVYEALQQYLNDSSLIQSKP